MVCHFRLERGSRVLLQHHARSMHTRLYRILRDVQRSPDLFEGHFLVVRQHEHNAILVGQARDGLTNRGSKLLPVQRITRKIPPISIAARAAVRGVLLLVGALDRLIDSYMARPRPARFFSSSLTSWNLTAGKMDELLGFTTQILGNWHPQTNITHQSDRDGSGRVVPSDVGNVLKRRP